MFDVDVSHGYLQFYPPHVVYCMYLTLALIMYSRTLQPLGGTRREDAEEEEEEQVVGGEGKKKTSPVHSTRTVCGGISLLLCAVVYV